MWMFGRGRDIYYQTTSRDRNRIRKELVKLRREYKEALESKDRSKAAQLRKEIEAKEMEMDIAD
jgi:hypothetical protein